MRKISAEEYRISKKKTQASFSELVILVVKENGILSEVVGYCTYVYNHASTCVNTMIFFTKFRRISAFWVVSQVGGSLRESVRSSGGTTCNYHGSIQCATSTMRYIKAPACNFSQVESLGVAHLACSSRQQRVGRSAKS